MCIFTNEREATQTFFCRVVWYRCCLVMYFPLDGNDIRALVVEIGSSTTKVGFAGEEHPSYLEPSCLGEPCDRNTLEGPSTQNTGGYKGAAVGDVPDKEPDLSPSPRRPGDTHSADLRLHWPVKDGIVCDWEGAEALLRSGLMAMCTGTCPNLSPQPIFMVEKSIISSASRRRYTVRFYTNLISICHPIYTHLHSIINIVYKMTTRHGLSSSDAIYFPNYSSFPGVLLCLLQNV